MSTADCESGDRLHAEEHVFWDCKLYMVQRATVIAYCLRKAEKNTRSQLQSS
jgi:hypothetical protein